MRIPEILRIREAVLAPAMAESVARPAWQRGSNQRVVEKFTGASYPTE
jgi:hypothetical protein